MERGLAGSNCFNAVGVGPGIWPLRLASLGVFLSKLQWCFCFAPTFIFLRGLRVCEPRGRPDISCATPRWLPALPIYRLAPVGDANVHLIVICFNIVLLFAKASIKQPQQGAGFSFPFPRFSFLFSHTALRVQGRPGGKGLLFTARRFSM